MKPMPLMFTLLLSASVMAADQPTNSEPKMPVNPDAEDPTFSMTVEEKELFTVTRLVNTFCRKYQAPVSVKHPDRVVSVAFNDSTCKDALLEIRRLDK
jgi:hypothetical protein